MSTPDATEARLLEIVEAIRALTPVQRGRLLRRLRILGLWDPEEYLSDQDRLRVATALGVDAHTVRTETADAITAPEPIVSSEDQLAVATEPETAPEPHTVTAREYRSAVSSRVVIAGENTTTTGTSTTMAPLPGQAPEEPIGIIFDGGTRGDPALGYGSYAIRWPGLPQQVVRLRFGDDVTGDEAEYDTLIAALEVTLQRLQDNDAAPESAKLDIRGDSHTVLSQVRGDVEIEGTALQPRCDRVRFLLRRFGSWTLSRYHRDRSEDDPSG